MFFVTECLENSVTRQFSGESDDLSPTPQDVSIQLMCHRKMEGESSFHQLKTDHAANPLAPTPRPPFLFVCTEHSATFFFI